MTLGQLQARVARRIGRNDQAASIPAWINLGLKRICLDHPFRNWSRTEVRAVADPPVLLWNYPDNCARIYSLRYINSLSGYRPLSRLGPREFEEKYQLADINPSYGIPENYCPEGAGIKIYPIPSIGSIKFNYSIWPAELVDPDDSPDIPYDELIIAASVVVADDELQVKTELKQDHVYTYMDLLYKTIRYENSNPDWTPKLQGFSSDSLDPVSYVGQRFILTSD